VVVQAAPLRLASEQALRQAREEGLTLRAGNNSTGYFGVCHDPSRTLPYRAQLKCGGKKVCLGNFATAEEAALCVARSPEGWRAAQEGAAAATAAALTSEEAVRQAQEEGLPLLQASSSNSATGYFGVYVDPRCKSKPYTARVWRAGGRSETLGQFATAEEAALCVARTPEGQAALGRATTFAELTPPPVPEPRLPEVQAEILFPKLDRAEAELRALLAAQDAAASKAAVEASDAETSALRAAQERHNAAMAEVIQPLSLEVAALAASQQQQQLTLETLQFKLTEQEEATKKALLEASESKAAALRAAQEQHRQASIAALEQHERALTAVQTQLQEREAAMEMALRENERLQDAEAAAKQRAAEAELRAAEMERRAEAAEAAASEARAALAALATARPSSPCAPGAKPSAAVTAAAAQALDVEGMWHDAMGIEGLQGTECMEVIAGMDDMEDLQNCAWHASEAGGGAGCNVDGAAPAAGEWYQDSEGMWHEVEDLQELQVAGLAQLAKEAHEAPPHEHVEQRGVGKRARS